jgi:anthranilate phosphoribosyltransferase
MFKDILIRLMNHAHLSREEAYQAMKQILDGEATPSQISSFISIITFRGATTDELIGLTKAMRDYAQPLLINHSTPVVDTCGTGGGALKTFNVSTASAIVASSSGLRVAKHGNRAVTSQTGSADVLQELGIAVNLSPEEMAVSLDQHQMCFMFAPMYHQAMKHAAATRKEVGFRSVFNLLGPMTNPAGAKYQVIGVFDKQYSIKMAETLRELGSKHVLIVAAEDKLDEFSIASPTHVTELKDGHVSQYLIQPSDVGIQQVSNLQDIQVITPKESAETILDVLQGKNKGSAYDMICLNAGAALYVGNKVKNIGDGVLLAKELIDSGKAFTHYLKLSGGNKGVVRHA